MISRLQQNAMGRLKILSFFSVFIILLSSCEFSNSNKKRALLYEMECKVDPSEEIAHSHNYNSRIIDVKLNGKITQTEFHSSPASVLLNGKNKYSFNSIIDVHEGEFIQVSIWRKVKSGKKKKANIIIEDYPRKSLYLNNSRVVDRSENGWEKLEVKLEIPEDVEALKVYAYLSESDTAYFDDLSIKHFNSNGYQSKYDDNLIIYKFECAADQRKDSIHTHSDGEDIKVVLNGEISEREYHSAPSSLFQTRKTPYSFVTAMTGIRKEQSYRVSIWRKNVDTNSVDKANLIIEGKPKGLFYLNNGAIVKKEIGGWEKIQIEFQIPPGLQELIIYTYSAKVDSVYFDDFTLELLKDKTYPSYKNENKLHLYFSDKDMQVFEKERLEAYYEGVHFSNDEWRKAILSDENNVIPIKARLKGDWLDHLEGIKWSFRIKTRKGKTFRRLKSFSIQNPKTRYFMHEYLSHKLFAQEDILTTRYDFSPVYINKTSVGIYAVEEHFTKQLIEYNLRREGPILKFDENPMWRSNALSTGVGKIPWRTTDNYKVSRILPFDKGSIKDNEVLADQFHIGHSLIYQFKNRLAGIEELLDIDKFARYYALLDVINGKHGLTWHNQRYYYNPIICKIEPINYDNFTEYYLEDKNARLLISRLDDGLTNTDFTNLVLYLFTSKEFIDTYLDYVQKYTEESFLKSFYDSQIEDIERLEPLIQEEFPEYDLNFQYLASNAMVLRKNMKYVSKLYDKGKYESIQLKNKPITVSKDYQESVLPYFINAYYYKEKGKGQLLLENYSGREVRFRKITNSKGKTLYRFENEIVLKPNVSSYTDTLLEVPYFQKASQITLEDSEIEETLISELTPWKKNIALSPYQQLLRNSDYSSMSAFDESNDTIYIRKGYHQINKKVLIPKNKIFFIEAGANIDLIDSATIISYSNLIAEGNASFPIKIFSSDKSANGFTVLQAEDRSFLNHVSFSNLNTLNYNGWRLSGAVNFYESNVTLTNCSFIENHCEDALNVIKSHFIVDNAFFNKIYADAFDSDFCTGTLKNSKFLDVDNDAIDFSTSQIEILNCEIKNILDKGISGGEDSKLQVRNCTIENANIGVASKDLSVVNLESVLINNANYGLVALQKKAEYGGGTLLTSKLKMTNCETRLLIEKGSFLNLNGKKIEGSKEKVAEMFY